MDKIAALSNDGEITIFSYADTIVSGYAFTKDAEIIRVLHLESSDKALVINLAGEMIETSMDDIEIEIVTDIYAEPEIFGGAGIKYIWKRKRCKYGK